MFHSLAAMPEPSTFRWDPSFSPVPSTSASNPAGESWGATHVSAMVAQPDGRVIVAGWFNSVDGRFRPGLARLNPDGSIDPSFDPAAAGCCLTFPYFTGWMNFPVRALALQADGRILVGGVTGPVETVGGTRRPNLMRLNPDGTVDGSFNVKISGNLVDFVIPDEVGVILVQDDQRILIGGGFARVAGRVCNGLARLNSDGSLDTTFDARILQPGFHDRARVQALALRPDGRVLVGGNFRLPNSGSGPNLAQLHPDGSLDSRFAVTLGRQDVIHAVTGIFLQEDGRSLIAGTFTEVGGRPRSGMARLLPDGGLDETFADAPGCQPLGFLRGGRVLGYRGEYSEERTNTRLAILDISPAGVPEGEGPRLRQLAALIGVPLPDGRWMIAGTGLRTAYSPTEGLALYDPALRRIDPEFAPRIGVRADLKALAITSDDQIFAMGGFTEMDGTEQFGIARLHPNGRVDSTFVWPFPQEQPTAILPLEGGESLVAVVPREPEFPSRSRLLYLKRDGTPKDASPVLTVQGTVLAMAKRPGSDFLVGRDLSGLDGVSGGTLLSVGPDGGVNATFKGPFSAAVRAIAATREGSMMIAADSGWWVNTPGRAEVWRLSPTETWSRIPFPIDRAREHLLAMTVDTEDRVLIAVGRRGASANAWRLLRLSGADWNTVETPTLNEPIHGRSFELRDSVVNAIGVQSSGALLIAGPFLFSGTVAHPGLARYEDPASRFSPATLQEPSLTSDGRFAFLLRGPQGTRYEIQSSIDLRTWVPMAIHTATSAQDRVTNTFERMHHRRFYRAVGVPP